MAGWIQDIVDPKLRQWEQFYRNRWQHDRVVRSTHGVNCTGGCSWMIYVKDGIVTWELQQVDYPLLQKELPPYEPRGCQRGISASWYLYSPLRVKYPYIRGALQDLWREARSRHGDDLVEAWRSIVENPQARARYQRARGKGGFRRTSWDECLDIIAAAFLYTAKKYGPDRCYGFSPIPAMSYLSYAAGSRFFQLFGGFNLSFYDWYTDLPNAFPEMWGEQTDVCESANWYEASYIVDIGACLNMTRTADVHFIPEARAHGSKFVVQAPDFSMVSKYADWWIPVKRGTDLELWMACNHVILKEFHVDRQVPYFTDYVTRYTDAPFLVIMEKKGDGWTPTRYLRANRIERYKDVDRGDWQLLVWDKDSQQPRLPKGCIGSRWPTKEEFHGKWNLKMEDLVDDTPLNPALTFLGEHDDVVMLTVRDHAEGRVFKRGVPIKYLETSQGKVPVATVWDLLLAQFGINRGLPGDYPKSYDEDNLFTPAWQEKYTGIGRETCIQLAREFASSAEHTKGRVMFIVGAALNHQLHNNLHYRAPQLALLLCGASGRNGGGMNHYVGQEKLTLNMSWIPLALAMDWSRPPRLQQAPLWHYVNSNEWKYEGPHTDYIPLAPDAEWSRAHTIDLIFRAVRLGWMPYYPQFNKNPFEVVAEAERAGCKTDKEIVDYVVKQLKERKLRFAIEDPDAPENWPRVWIIWRGNALQSSAKGTEYFYQTYLGTHTNIYADEVAQGSVKEVQWRESPRGKLDLVVQLNFRMESTAIYCDIVLPTATWYEKNDLNTTDLHSYIHNLGEAVPPCWESKSDWEIFKAIAKRIQEVAPRYFPRPVKDIVYRPLMHDTPDEITQPALDGIKDWYKGECEPIPGQTMGHLQVVERDYTNIYNKFISYGPLMKKFGLYSHGLHVDITQQYEELNDYKVHPQVEWGGNRYPSLSDAVHAAEVLLRTSPETNGEVLFKAWQEESKHTGMDLTYMGEMFKGMRYNWLDVVAQPRRTFPSPCWTGMTIEGRAYAPYCTNVELLIPWRTLTGRQHIYLDHPVYIEFDEQLPTSKPMPEPQTWGDLRKSRPEGKCYVANIIMPHGKWNIHSTYKDNHRMLTLSRGMEPVWINDKDAAEIGVKDNDWIEVYNDHGVVVARCVVSARVPRGLSLFYHAPERTIDIPRSPIRGMRRGGNHNALTRIRLKPCYLTGGYAQFSYFFNTWGPVVPVRDNYVYIRKYPGEVRY